MRYVINPSSSHKRSPTYPVNGGNPRLRARPAVEESPAPEPGTPALLSSALIGFGSIRRRRAGLGRMQSARFVCRRAVDGDTL